MSVKANYIYNLSYSVFNSIFQLITLPYIARILGKENIGLQAFVASLCQYFIFFAILGLSLYGVREIAYVRNDIKKLTNTFFDLCIILFSTTFLASIAYIIFIQSQDPELHILLWIQGIALATAGFDISWFFQGIEDFKKLAIRNFVVKAATIILIFLLIKEKNDIILYIILLTLGNAISQLVMWKYALNYVTLHLYSYDKQRILKHLYKNLKMFLLQISIQVYQYLDKTMLGYIVGIGEVAVYDLAQKFVRISLLITSSLGAVIMPRVSNLLVEKKQSEAINNIEYSLKFAISMSFPIIAIIVLLSNIFIPIFLGPDYIEVSRLMTMLSPIILIIPIGNIIGIQLMIPMGKELSVVISPLLGALTNVLLNTLLIPKMQSNGAVVASIFAELTGTLFTVFLMRRYINIFKISISCYKSFIATIGMILSIVLFIYFVPVAQIYKLILSCIFGLITYLIILLILKEELLLNSFQMKINKHK